MVLFHPNVPTPYFTCIFTSTRPISEEDDGYAEAAKRMVELSSVAEGYLGMDSVRDANTGHGITVSYWRSRGAMLEWKQQVEHMQVQQKGRDKYYPDYHIHIAEVQHEYSKESSSSKFLQGQHESP